MRGLRDKHINTMASKTVTPSQFCWQLYLLLFLKKKKKSCTDSQWKTREYECRTHRMHESEKIARKFAGKNEFVQSTKRRAIPSPLAYAALGLIRPEIRERTTTAVGCHFPSHCRLVTVVVVGSCLLLLRRRRHHSSPSA